MSQKQIKILGWVATFMSVMMYVSYIPQIINNLSGTQGGDWIQPGVAAINCTLWVCYGLMKEDRDIPLAAANAPGILFGIVTVITATMH
ncbi:MAG: SemiSWEET family transporter [Streptococcus sp.]|nr:SemiSWEET family transporter [Streptococcus sp.]